MTRSQKWTQWGITFTRRNSKQGEPKGSLFLLCFISRACHIPDVEPTTPTPEPEDLSSSQSVPAVRKTKTKKEKPLDLEMAQALWNTVSCAIEYGGLGGGTWGWESKAGWKAYNDAKGKDYLTLTITCRMKDYEQEESLTPWVDMSTDWLYKKMQEFVADAKQPNWIRVQYAGMLATRENPPEEDAVTGDAFLQYAFLGEIRFG